VQYLSVSSLDQYTLGCQAVRTLGLKTLAENAVAYDHVTYMWRDHAESWSSVDLAETRIVRLVEVDLKVCGATDPLLILL